jgi:UDP-N-acetylglucosamine--N-acetylmuramyl-(pentapeptide) pyrophosphoryl-undecaprenol N-acetylglucosamine transferase
VLEENGSAVVIKEKELTSDKLLSTIDEIITDEKKLSEMKKNSQALGVKDSATKIAIIIENLVSGDNKNAGNGRIYSKK